MHDRYIGAWSKAIETSQQRAASGSWAWPRLHAHEELKLHHPAAVLQDQEQEVLFLPADRYFFWNCER